jgi:hypothetical protein
MIRHLPKSANGVLGLKREAYPRRNDLVFEPWRSNVHKLCHGFRWLAAVVVLVCRSECLGRVVELLRAQPLTGSGTGVPFAAFG